MSGFVLDASPAAPLRAVRDVIKEVRGDAACTWSQTKPHVSISCCRTATETDPWARKARQIDPNHAPLRITSVALVDVRPDDLTKRLEWYPAAALIPLSGGRTAGDVDGRARTWLVSGWG